MNEVVRLIAMVFFSIVALSIFAYQTIELLSSIYELVDSYSSSNYTSTDKQLSFYSKER